MPASPRALTPWLRQKAASAIRCIRTDGCWFGSSRRSANSSAKTRPAETNRQQLVYRPVVKPGPPLSVVLDGLVKPRPPLLRVNRRILVFFFRRGWSGFHATPDNGRRGWSGFHAAPDKGWRGWSGFHAAPEKVWLRDHELPAGLGVLVGCLVALFFFCGVGVVDDEVVEAEGVGCFGGGD